jgi:hypothetical protein
MILSSFTIGQLTNKSCSATQVFYWAPDPELFLVNTTRSHAVIWCLYSQENTSFRLFFYSFILAGHRHQGKYRRRQVFRHPLSRSGTGIKTAGCRWLIPVRPGYSIENFIVLVPDRPFTETPAFRHLCVIKYVDVDVLVPVRVMNFMFFVVFMMFMFVHVHGQVTVMFMYVFISMSMFIFTSIPCSCDMNLHKDKNMDVDVAWTRTRLCLCLWTSTWT